MFIIDGIGAMLTAALLMFLLGNLNEYFGVPATTLTYLAVIAAAFCIYSFTCFFVGRKNPPPFIRTIAIANLLYCLLTLVILITRFSEITTLGIAYFVGEMGIICVLVYTELAVASSISNVKGA